MKNFVPFLVAMSIALTPGISNANNPQMITLQNTNNENSLEYLSPAIIAVCSTNNNQKNIGAGVCVTKYGHIVTNSHVIDNGNNISIYLSDGTRAQATLLYKDSVLDFAIIKADNINIPYLPINIEDVKIGQPVIAVGTPISLMLKHTFTKGIISATNRTIKVNTDNGEHYMHSLIQHDASINYGNSGGPLLNDKGEVIGINTLKISAGEGIGFAIPCKSFASILNKFTNKNDYNLGYIGIYGFDAEIAKFNKLTNANFGFYIESIDENSPLKNKLKPSDVIISINGHQINNANDFRYELYKYSAGNKITIKYVSDRETNECTISLDKR